MGVAAAWADASKIVAQAMAGRDPRPERQDANLARHTNSVKTVSQRMTELAKKQVETWPRMEQVLRDHVWPSLGNRSIADITQAEVHELLDKLVAADKHGTARAVRKMMSRLLNYAAEKSLIAVSPMAGMKRRDLTLQPKERALSD